MRWLGWSALALALACGPLPAAAQIFNQPLNQVELDQQVSADNVSSFTFNSPQKSLAALTVKAGASAGFAMVFDAATPPSGAVSSCTSAATARPCLMWCVPLAANGWADKQWNSPMSFTTGIIAVFSTTGCSTVTASATAMIMGQAP